MLYVLKIALGSLAAHKLRAILAMLGVFLGALALTSVQHVSQAMVLKAEQEVEKVGPNLFVVTSYLVRFTRRGDARFSGEAKTFTIADARALEENLPSVVEAAPFVITDMSIRAANTKIPCQIVATWPEFTDVRAFQPDIGRFFTQEEVANRDKVVVLGRKIATRLFGDPEAALGQRVFFFRAVFRVIGVMEPKGRDLAGTDQDEQVFMPLSTYMRRAANIDWINGVFIQLADGADLPDIRQSATELMRERHRIQRGEADDFSVLAASESIQLQREVLQLVNTLGLIASSVSFAVGGLGVLSIMVLLVRLRRVEIGIRRAIGATRSNIVRQFLFESALMAGTGGGVGVLAAIGLLAVVYEFGGFPWVIDPSLIGLAVGGSAAIGVAAGAYPAYQASRVEILDVLRNE
jgi:putative ABC transport system permease protein